MGLDVTKLKTIPLIDVITESLRGFNVGMIVTRLRQQTLLEVNGLERDHQRLFWLKFLDESWEKDRLHTFFSNWGGDFAPQVLDSLTGAGLTHRAEVFAQAMHLFGTPYPASETTRSQYFGQSSLEGELNAFKDKLLKLSAAFGSKEAYQEEIEHFVQRTPVLDAWAAEKRTKLSESDRLDWLIRRLAWSVPPKDHEDLKRWPRPYQILFLLHTFMAEVMNGSVHQFFYNSDGDFAPDVVEALKNLGLHEHAAVLQSGIDMFDAPYPTDNQARREAYFHGEWSEWDNKLADLTDIFDDGAVYEGMLKLAKRENILPQ
jgi:hypothetical protein